MAPPPLPNEIIARILELVAEPIHVPNLHRHEAYQTLISSALVSKAFGALATEQLYRRLNVAWDTEDYYGPLTYDSMCLEIALLRYEGLGRLTRRLSLDGSALHIVEEITSADEDSVRRSTAIFLTCCTSLTTLELVGFSDDLLQELIAQVGEKRGDLPELLLTRSRREFGDSTDITTLANLLRPYPSLQSLCISRRLSILPADAEAFISDGILLPLARLTYLEVGAYAHGVLAVVVSNPLSTLGHLVIHLGSHEDEFPFLRTYVPKLATLTHFEATMPLLDYLKILIPLLSHCTALTRARFSVKPKPKKHERIRCEDTDLTQLPQSLRELDLWESGLGFAPTMVFMEAEGFSVCTVTPASWCWTKDENTAWDALDEGR